MSLDPRTTQKVKNRQLLASSPNLALLQELERIADALPAEQLLPVLTHIKDLLEALQDKDISFGEVVEQLESVKQAIEAKELSVTVPDRTDEVLKGLKAVAEAVKANRTDPVDLSSLERTLEKAIASIRIPEAPPAVPVFPLDDDGKVPISLSEEDLERLSKTLGKSVVVSGGGGGYGLALKLTMQDVFINQQFKLAEGPVNASGYLYIGYEDKNGAWYIKRRDNTTKAWRFAKGASAFSTAWTNKASQSYDTFSNTF